MRKERYAQMGKREAVLYELRVNERNAWAFLVAAAHASTALDAIARLGEDDHRVIDWRRCIDELNKFHETIVGGRG